MATIHNFEVTSNKFNVDKIYTYVINSSLNLLLLNILLQNFHIAVGTNISSRVLSDEGILAFLI
jgi:hypothetical protein